MCGVCVFYCGGVGPLVSCRGRGLGGLGEGGGEGTKGVCVCVCTVGEVRGGGWRRMWHGMGERQDRRKAEGEWEEVEKNARNQLFFLVAGFLHQSTAGFLLLFYWFALIPFPPPPPHTTPKASSRLYHVALPPTPASYTFRRSRKGWVGAKRRCVCVCGGVCVGVFVTIVCTCAAFIVLLCISVYFACLFAGGG